MTSDPTVWQGPLLPAPSLHLSVPQAATRQVEAAIDAFGQGAFDVALTLSGSAEGMISRDGPHMFSWLRDNPRAQERFSERKEWIALLNRERDWLKHGGDAQMEIECAPAAFMIARAASKLEVWTPKMEEFRGWLMKHLEEI